MLVEALPICCSLPDVVEICCSDEDTSRDDGSEILQRKNIRVQMNTSQAIQDTKCLSSQAEV